VTTTGAPVPAYTVLSVQQANGQDEMGKYGNGHAINVRLDNGSGSTFTVFVPDADTANTAKVQRLVESRAIAVAAIHNLGTASGG
jgi:predicted RNA-binding protein with TRAM domain